MSLGLVGKKCGMTRVFTREGVTIPVTVIEIKPNRITQIKTKENDGYEAIQVTAGNVKRSNKSMAGHLAKAKVEAGEGLWEFRLDSLANYKLGDAITVSDVVIEGQLVDVVGVSKGKGFAGVIKRHHFSSQDATHGNSLSHRAPGSTGQRQTPGRVFKNKRMAGHLGNERVTIQNQKIVKIDKERNLLLIKGVVPGAPGGFVIVLPAVKVKTEVK